MTGLLKAILQPGKALALCCSFVVFAPLDARAANDTFVSMTSETGDFIGQGQTYFYGAGDGTFGATKNFDNGVSVSFTNPSHNWDLDFAAPQSVLLAPGTYLGATRWPFQNATEPGLDVSGDGRGCNTLTGSFVIKLVSYGSGTTINAFWATFEQHCEGDVPALRGEIRYNVPPLDFYTLTPCRLVDTRNPAGPLGGPALVPGPGRTFVFAGACGVPADAKALSVNIAVTGPTATGHLRIYPVGAAVPLTAAINYSAGQTRTNNAVVSVGGNADLVVACFQGSGSTHFIVDVNGYFK
jgi:hypothetical protein